MTPSGESLDRSEVGLASLQGLLRNANAIVGLEGKAVTLMFIRLLQGRAEDDAAREQVGRALALDQRSDADQSDP